MQVDVNDIIILDVSDLTEEEKVGARCVAEQVSDAITCKVSLISDSREKLQIENYGFTDEEDEVFMTHLYSMLGMNFDDSEGVSS